MWVRLICAEGLALMASFEFHDRMNWISFLYFLKPPKISVAYLPQHALLCFTTGLAGLQLARGSPSIRSCASSSNVDYSRDCLSGNLCRSHVPPLWKQLDYRSITSLGGINWQNGHSSRMDRAVTLSVRPKTNSPCGAAAGCERIKWPRAQISCTSVGILLRDSTQSLLDLADGNC